MRVPYIDPSGSVGFAFLCEAIQLGDEGIRLLNGAEVVPCFGFAEKIRRFCCEHHAG